MKLTSAWAAFARDVRTFFAILSERDTVIASTKTALVIGTILALINHGQQMLSGHVSASWVIPMLVTYCVPFCTATIGQIHGKSQRDALRQEEGTREDG